MTMIDKTWNAWDFLDSVCSANFCANKSSDQNSLEQQNMHSLQWINKQWKIHLSRPFVPWLQYVPQSMHSTRVQGRHDEAGEIKINLDVFLQQRSPLLLCIVDNIRKLSF